MCLLAISALAACPGAGEGGASDGGSRAVSDTASAGEPGARSARVAPGIEVLLADSLHLVRGRRVGLVTNHTGVLAGHPAAGPPGEGTTIDALHRHPDVELVALYGPEHSIRGDVEGGEGVESGVDRATGAPIFSLYGEVRKPTPGMLEGVDVLLFDIQDVGARYYTYVYTMALAMEGAGEAGIPFVVLDRPNPIGGVKVQGNVLEPEFATFVGMFPIPMRHGMTPGELARLFRGEFGVDAELHVVPAAGWRRAMWFGKTGLPWVPPSPNMPSVESATHYPGTCLFEGTNLSVGRGTERAFQWIGAPWLDGERLAERLNAHGLPGVRFEAVRFTPREPGDRKFGDTEVQGVRFVKTSDAYDPTVAAVAALVETRRMSGDRWEWRVSHFDRLAGTDALRTGIEAGRSVTELTAGWAEELARFGELRRRHLVYP